MKIKNVRMGFATNSSSSHSIIIAGSTTGSTPDDFSFGWEKFICDNKEDKRKYFSAQLYSSLSLQIGEEITLLVIKGLFGDCLEEFAKRGYVGVDHQSRLDVPLDFRGKPNIAFYKDFAESIINNDKLHILGGNDNTNEDENAVADTNYTWTKMINEQSVDSLPIAYKNNFGEWILFNKGNGTKIVLDFRKETITRPSSAKSEFPELIDLKITDYCPIGCTYCYQDSTKKGKHGDYATISHITDFYENKGLFEVAIGGGEPTMHPQFVEILENLKSKNIVPNFTTKSTRWMVSDTDKAKRILNAVGGFAYSVDSAQEALDVISVYDSLTERINARDKINIQYIPENHSSLELEKLLVSLRDSSFYGNVTLLGYKNVGRGGSTPYEHKSLISEILRLKQKHQFWFKIGIDTVLAKKYEEDLKNNNISDVLYYSNEGKHSMYIDAVAMKYGSSSFTDKYHTFTSSSYGSTSPSISEMFETVGVE